MTVRIQDHYATVRAPKTKPESTGDPRSSLDAANLWLISVSQDQDRLTLFVTTPDDNLTLTRTTAQISALDRALRPTIRLPSKKWRRQKTSELSAYLTTLARDPSVRESEAWREFIEPGETDQASKRQEHRVKRVRSAMDVSSPPQPSSPERAPTTPELSPPVSRRRSRKAQTSLSDFDLVRVLGKGCAGKVLLVRHKSTKQLYAMKAIFKTHVLAHRELQHTLTEQSVLVKATTESNPFVVRLWWSFHDARSLYLVMDFHPGGDLATQLARWGRLGRDRARFYAAEITEGLIGLHKAGVIYRDLKPENILIGLDGHIVLTDFGLSKQFEREETTRPSLHKSASTPAPGFWLERRETTSTFCGVRTHSTPAALTPHRRPSISHPRSFSASSTATRSTGGRSARCSTRC